MKTFNIGNDRILKLGKNNDDIRILDKTTKKEALFTSSRWASFLLRLDEIDNELCKLTQGEDVAYRIHYGGGWHASLTKGFRCIDLRKFYVPFGETTIKPTKTGIALRLDEWPRFKQAIANLHRDNPVVTNFVPCFLAQDHTTPQGLNSCLECNAFSSTLM